MAKTIHLPCKNKPLHTAECSDCSQLEHRVENLEECCEDVNEALDGKQDTLESGVNIKTINGDSLLGSGDMVISSGGDTVSYTQTQTSGNELGTITINGTPSKIYGVDYSSKQDALVSGTNIKTVNNNSLLGSGNVSIAEDAANNMKFDSYDSDGINFYTDDGDSDCLLTNTSGQKKLVSGTNIKTVNGNSLLGSGDLTISGGGAKNVWYGTCSTSSATSQKDITTSSGDFALTTGNMVRIKFTNSNSANAPTLKIDNATAATVKTLNTSVYNHAWASGEVVDFVYDGTYFMMVDGGLASSNVYGITKLTNSTSSTSTTTAATPSAVKDAYDLANGKQDALVSGTNIKTINNNSLLGSGDLSIPTGTTATVTQVSLTVASWNATTTCTVSVTGVTTSNSVIVSPAPAYIADYVAAGVYCSAQAAGTLTFTASSTPTADLVVNVIVVG